MDELWPGLGDCYKPLLVGCSFGVLFPFEEWLGFVIVFVTTAFFRVSRRCFFSFASHVNNFVGSLVQGMGSVFVHSELPCTSTRFV